jgi:hypothetical protein
VVRAALACQLRHRHASKPRHGSNAYTDDNPGRDHEHVEQLGDGGQHWLDDRSHDRDGQDYEDYLWPLPPLPWVCAPSGCPMVGPPGRHGQRAPPRGEDGSMTRQDEARQLLAKLDELAQDETLSEEDATVLVVGLAGILPKMQQNPT